MDKQIIQIIMVKLSIAIIILTLCNCNSKLNNNNVSNISSEIITDLKKLNLYGSVSEVNETVYSVMVTGDEITKREIALLPLSQKYVFDKSGFYTNITFFNLNGVTEDIQVLRLEDEVMWKKLNGEEDDIIRFSKLDGSGREIITNKFSPKGELLFTNQYQYNDTISIIKQLNGSGKWLSTTTLVMNLSGEVVHSLNKRENGNQSTLMNTDFDEFGNVLKQFIINEKADTSKISYEYKYDINNNWTYRLTNIDGVSQNITEREITYY